MTTGTTCKANRRRFRRHRHRPLVIPTVTATTASVVGQEWDHHRIRIRMRAHSVDLSKDNRRRLLRLEDPPIRRRLLEAAAIAHSVDLNNSSRPPLLLRLGDPPIRHRLLEAAAAI